MVRLLERLAYTFMLAFVVFFVGYVLTRGSVGLFLWTLAHPKYFALIVAGALTAGICWIVWSDPEWPKL